MGAVEWVRLMDIEKAGLRPRINLVVGKALPNAANVDRRGVDNWELEVFNGVLHDPHGVFHFFLWHKLEHLFSHRDKRHVPNVIEDIWLEVPADHGRKDA